MTRVALNPGALALPALAAVLLTAAGAQAHEQIENETVREDRALDRPGHGDDAKRRKPVWLDGGFGWQRLDLTTFHVQRVQDSTALTADLAPRVAGGPALNGGLGVRLSVLTIGARIGATFFDSAASDQQDGSLQLYSINLELGLRVPIGRLEPYLVLGGGYSVLGGLGDAFTGLGQGLDIDGANGRLGLGLDYFMSPHVSLGIRATGEVLFLSRSGVPLRDLAAPETVNTVGEAKARTLEGDGSSIGTLIGVTVGPGLHF